MKKDSKKTKKEIIPIMYCFDKNYVIPAAVTFYSLLEHADPNYLYKFYVLHSDITEYQQEKLQETIAPFKDICELEFLNMEHRFDDIWNKIYKGGHFSKEVMYKILVASIFPQYDKLIVTDVDVVFLGDVSKSYTEFDTKEDAYLAGIKPIGRISNYYKESYRKEWTEEEIKKLGHFCGGYLVANLKKIREDNMEEVFVDSFVKNGYRLNQMEQDILNVCCYPKIKLLPLNYVACSYMWDYYKTEEDKKNDENYSYEEIVDAMENPIQLHYATSTKPWKSVDCTLSEIWFEYIVKTPFLKDYLNWLPEHIVLPKVPEPVQQRSAIGRIIGYIKHDPLFLFKKKTYVRIYRKLQRKMSFLKTKETLFIFDDVYPCELSPFRYEEYEYYFNKFKKVVVVTTGKTLSALKVNKNIKEVIDEYVSKNPKRKNDFIIHPAVDEGTYNLLEDTVFSTKRKLATVTFINNLKNPFVDNIALFEKLNIPFVFTLYPGGGFKIKDEASDEKLKKAFSSPMFRKVIVTQKITKDYLIDNKLCEEENIELIPGVVTPSSMLDTDNENKKHFGKNKKKLDICFVAHKYMEQGKDKGYDLFIEVAKKLSKKHSNVKFHVVGDFNENDIDVSDIKNNITFYGVKEKDWFNEFYKDKDIILSPNRPFILSKGSFDGFPTGCGTEAMLNEVALFATDELKQNIFFEDKKDMVIIKPNEKDILDKIEYYYNHPEELKEISKNGCEKVKENYSSEKQLESRVDIIRKNMQ